MEIISGISNIEKPENLNDIYCIIKNNKDGFYWVINLENHPGSFLLDHTYHSFLPPPFKQDIESIVVIQPAI